MQDYIEALGREVARIVTAPYAPSLQDLYGIARQSSSSQIKLWASHKPCQVGALVDVLVDGLSRSSYALNLLQIFTQVPTARDALLQRYPYILDQFLQKSIEDGQAEVSRYSLQANGKALTCLASQYISACISILSSPLPPGFVTPARLAPFFTRLICTMGNNPCAETIQPLHRLISGLQTSPRLLFDIPQETMSSLQLELTKTLRNLDDHMGNLLCLSTFAQISASGRKAQDGDAQAPPWLQNINHFFGPKRGLKTLDLVVLRVILACSSSCSSLTTNQAAESVRLAIGICDSVEQGQRDAWVAANRPKIAKLCEKVTRSGISPAVQMLGVAFLTALLPPSVTSPGISGTALQWLVSKDSGLVLDVLSLDMISRLTNMVACEDSDVCRDSLVNMENELLCDVFALFISSSFFRSGEQDASSPPELKILQSFMKNARNTITKATCTFSQIQPMMLRESLPALRTLDKSSSTRQDWRTGLAETLAFNTQASQEMMIRKVEEICYDLENRCSDIEAPLRAVEVERNKALQEAEETRRLNHELELRLQEATGTIAALRQEIANLEGHAENASGQIQELSERLDAARKELEEQRRESQDSVHSEREKARTRELDLIAAVTEKEDQLEGLQDVVREKESTNAELRRTLDAVMEDKSSLLEDKNALTQEVARVKQQAEDLEAALVRKDEEIERLLAIKDDTEARAEILQDKLNEEVTTSDNLKSALRKTEDELNTELETAKKQFGEQLRECAKRNDEISSLQRSMQTAASSATKELQTKDKRIQYLEKKVQHLRDERAAKAREFSEAQQHIGRLMNVMGFQTGPTGSNPSHKQSRTRSTAGPPQSTPQEQTRSTGYTQPEGDDFANMSFESDGSFAGRRSPKRHRDNAFPMEKIPPSSQVPERKRNSVCPSGARDRRERRILGEADQNSQNSQPGTQESRKSASSQRKSFPDSQFHGTGEENHFHDLDLDMDLEFSKDFIFTSTPAAEANNVLPEVRH
ncbi:hypothetical protein ATEIFO6365_0010027400 [Aspergillus terreus]|uniref:Uncharacterized protein n=1 Tax=Aspergillus terreus TaxID=33178 RepID=A0A5M3ZAY1_ASPTE|nr:hypothetical protein ATETN484_0012025300 [Aspergillus terreus]GFF19501.1 hypothetical protein ATEIFO6365_0010027400 [Aspergillus terreus]